MTRRRRLSRELVVEKAVELANAAGDPGALTLTGLAQALDIRVPSLYNHVDGLQGLHRELAGWSQSRLLLVFQEAVGMAVGKEALRRLAWAYRAFAHQNPGVYPFLLEAADPGDAELQHTSAALVQFLQLILGSVGLEGDAALHAIRGFRSLLHGYVSLEGLGGFRLALDRDESFRWVLEVYLAGLG